MLIVVIIVIVFIIVVIVIIVAGVLTPKIPCSAKSTTYKL